jgi:hypothetical protein
MASVISLRPHITLFGSLCPSVFVKEKSKGAKRIELGFSYAEVAAALGKPSPDPARMMVVRAVVKLPKEMDVNV